MALRRVRVYPKANWGMEVKPANGLGLNANQLNWPVEAGQYSEPDLQERKTLAPVPREEANLEAERGEVAFTNLNKDGIPETYKVGGERHYDGGTPLNLPEKSFIFSRDKGMKVKDKTVLEQFGITNAPKGGVTPADIAKKYDVNKYKKILLDKNSDKLQRDTAEMMIVNYNLKLGKLALIQESTKGFPNGIPFIAMPYLEDAGIEAEELMGQQSIEQAPEEDQGEILSMGQYGMELPRAQYGIPGRDTRMPAGSKFWEDAYTPTGQAVRQEYMIDWRGNKVPTGQMQMVSGAAAIPKAPGVVPAGSVPRTPGSTAAPNVVTPSSGWWSNTVLQPAYNPNDRSISVNSAKGDIGTLAKYARAFNELGAKGKVVQHRTKGYNYFYGDFRPQDYEKAIAEGEWGTEAVANMTETEIRKKVFEKLGITADESLIENPQSLYNDKAWFEGTFAPAFYKLLPEKQFREPKLDAKGNKTYGDDLEFGFDHFDGLFQKKPFMQPTGGGEDQRPAEPMKPEQKASQYAPWWLQDIVKTTGSFGDMMRVKKYTPWQDEAPVQYAQPQYFSPERELSANAEQMNIGTQGAATFTGPQAYNARFSQMAGQAAKNSADILAKYNNLNVGVANETEKFNVDTFNKYAETKAANATALYDKYTVANQQFDNSRNQARQELRQSYIDGITNAAQTQALNTMFPNYAVNPLTGGTRIFTGGPDELPAFKPEDFATEISDWMKRKPANVQNEDDWLDIFMQTKGYGGKRYSTQDPDQYGYNDPRYQGYPGGRKPKGG